MNKAGTWDVWIEAELVGTGSSTGCGVQTEHRVQCGTSMTADAAGLGGVFAL